MAVGISVSPLRRPQPYRGVVEHRAAAGQAGSALVKRLMPIPSAKAWFGHSPSTITTRFCMPSKARAWTTTLPLPLPMRMRSPSRTPSPASASGWTSAVGLPSRAMLGRRVVEARVQERARRRRHEPKRPRRVAVIDHREMVREMPACARAPAPNAAQSGAEMEFLVGMAEPVEEMPGLEPGPAIEPDAFLECVRPGQAAGAQRLLDDLERGHLEPGMAGAEPFRQSRRPPRGSSGTRRRAAARRARSAEMCGRRRCRCRRVREMSSPAARYRPSQRSRS